MCARKLSSRNIFFCGGVYVDDEEKKKGNECIILDSEKTKDCYRGLGTRLFQEVKRIDP